MRLIPSRAETQSLWAAKLLLLLGLLLLVRIASAHEGDPVDPKRPWRMTGKAASEIPEELKGVGITEKLGQQLDLKLKFKDENGETVELGKYFDGKRPVLLSPVYYGCPGLCNFHLNGVTEVLKKLEWTAGDNFQVVIVSFDASETPELARKKKESHLQELGRPEAAKGWHFLTGSQESIDALTQQIGFGFKWDKISEQWAHTSASHVFSPTGVLTRYLYGISFDPKTVRLSLVEAAEGKVGTVMDRLILTCFHYDPDQRGYSFYAYNIMKAGAGASVLVFGMVMIPVWLREKRRSQG